MVNRPPVHEQCASLLPVALKKYGHPREGNQAVELIPSLGAKFQDKSKEYSGSNDPTTFNNDMRGGDTYERGLLYSGALLGTDEHILMLNEIERVIGK